MEALKMILIVVLCLVVTVIVSLCMRPDPCTHNSTLDPGPDLVTMDDFMKVRAASNEVWKAQSNNNKVNLKAMTMVQDAVVKNRKTILTHQDYLQEMADNMITLGKMLMQVVKEKNESVTKSNR